ncbi:MAG: NADP oxidoreductase [Marivivens sp.]|nr:NADP oxidoreductase [Marivivens sp.]
MKIGIIGGTGWLGSALGKALLDRGHAPDDLIILNRSGPRDDYFGRQVVWAADVTDLVDRSDVIILSVRPQDWPALNFDAKGKLAISFMAGVNIATLGNRVIRAIPNAAAEIGTSYSPWFAGPAVTADDKATANDILSAFGTCDELASESEIDLMTALSGSGPAYPALMAATMMKFLTDNGVSPDIAARATEATICDAAQLLRGEAQNATEWVKVFIDYAGTTAAGLTTAEAGGFSTALYSGLSAATQKAKDMGAD